METEPSHSEAAPVSRPELDTSVGGAPGREAALQARPRETGWGARSSRPGVGCAHPPGPRGSPLGLLCSICGWRQEEPGLQAPSAPSLWGCFLPATSHPSAPAQQPFLSPPRFLLQLALRGPAGPMGLTGRPGPMVSAGRMGEGRGAPLASLAPLSPCPFSPAHCGRTHFKLPSTLILPLAPGVGEGPWVGGCRALHTHWLPLCLLTPGL